MSRLETVCQVTDWRLDYIHMTYQFVLFDPLEPSFNVCKNDIMETKIIYVGDSNNRLLLGLFPGESKLCKTLFFFSVKSNSAPILIKSHCISTVQEDLAFTRSGNLFKFIGGVNLGSTYENMKVLTTGGCFNYKTYIPFDFVS